jgi:hypothetical protein
MRADAPLGLIVVRSSGSVPSGMLEGVTVPAKPVTTASPRFKIGACALAGWISSAENAAVAATAA